MNKRKKLTTADLVKIKKTAFARWNKDGLPSRRTVEYLKGQVDLHGDSAELLCYYADTLELADDDAAGEDAAVYYKKALKLNPDYGPALEGLGWHYDVRDNLALAMRSFTRAWLTAKPGDAVVGIARIKAQQGLRSKWGKEFTDELTKAKLSRWGRRVAREVLAGDWDR